MNKINKIIITSVLLLGTACTTVKKFFGVDNSEEQVTPVENNSTGEVIDNGVDFSASQTNYTEFLIFCAIVMVVLAGVNFYLKRNDEK